MSKEEFLRQLEANLMIGEAEKDEVMCYYSEYFEEAGPENEQAVLSELGDPVALARKLTAECKEDMTGAAGTAGDNAETGNSGESDKTDTKKRDGGSGDAGDGAWQHDGNSGSYNAYGNYHEQAYGSMGRDLGAAIEEAVRSVLKAAAGVMEDAKKMADVSGFSLPVVSMMAHRSKS